MKNVAAYCRVSTDKADQNNSFENQRNYFEQYINQNPEWSLYEIYTDDGISGTSTKKRSGFNRMIQDARERKFKLILTKEVSRFSRNILDTIRYTRELKDYGVTVFFLNDGIHTADPDAELRLSIMGSIAQEESRKTSERVRWGQHRQMEKGVVFGRSMLGYDIKNGIMHVNPEGAKLVKLIYHKFLEERKGTRIIARELRESGYKTMTGNMNWNNSVILKILHNEKYCGDLIQKKTYTPNYLTHEKKYNYGCEKKIYIPNHHEAIIERSVWDQVQKELARRQSIHHSPSICGTRHPLSGKIKCSECHSAFVARYKKRTDGSYSKAWRCLEAVHNGKKHIDSKGNTIGCSIHHQIKEAVFMELLQRSVQELEIDRNSITEKLLDIISQVSSAQIPITKESTGNLENRIASLKKQQSRLLSLFLEDIIKKSQLRQVNLIFEKEIHQLETKLDCIQKQKTSLSPLFDIKNQIIGLLSGQRQSDIFYCSLVKQITVLPDYTVKIYLELTSDTQNYILQKNLLFVLLQDKFLNQSQYEACLEQLK